MRNKIYLILQKYNLFCTVEELCDGVAVYNQKKITQGRDQDVNQNLQQVSHHRVSSTQSQYQ